MKKTHLSNLVYPFNSKHVIRFLGTSKQGKYISDYLREIGAKTFIFEENYIDKDYLIDYSKFYSRSFGPIKKCTNRLHFFSNSFSDADFNHILLDYNKEASNNFISSYLGFVVVKPIKDPEGNDLIGRTALKTYPEVVNKRRSKHNLRFHITVPNRVSLFGIPLKVESLPFQVQDNAVGACATNACWTAIHPLNELFGTQKLSPYEVTEMSVSFPTLEERNFPNAEGLGLLQMKGYFNRNGLETEFINIELIQKS
jgi:hypothetical protein